MPAMQISEGIVNIIELAGHELQEVKERLKRVMQERVEEMKELMKEIQNDVCRVRETSMRLDKTDEREQVRTLENAFLLGMSEDHSTPTPHNRPQEEEEAMRGGDPVSVRWQRERGRDEESEITSVSVESEDEEQPVTIRGRMITHKRQGQGSARSSTGYELRGREELRLPERFRQMPLIYKGPQVGERYQPFSFTVMNCILDKIPPPTEGGRAWMGKFCQHTMGHKIAIGDWTALLGKQLGLWEIQQVEIVAGTTRCPDAEPFAKHATAVGSAMLDKFPVRPGVMQSLTFSIKEDEKISTFLSQCKESWTDKAGVHPATEPLQTTLFRSAVTSGLPAVVREALGNNPDIPGCSTEQWEKHLAHHMKRYRAKQKEDKQITDLHKCNSLSFNWKRLGKRPMRQKRIPQRVRTR
ncbi:uncharacterized protein [Narcine bancroftii]|uniref:uncharacterized protein isoform X1 n=1 Tax=Narcine bancroftii TaxID=1343680 RepID=UPI003831EA93